MNLIYAPKSAQETAKEYAYKVIRDNIVNLRLKPGCALNDMEIANVLGISRTPVREAINQLKEESGIVEIFPQRGMRVALIDPNIIREVRFMRLTLEKAIVAQTCEDATQEDLSWMDENVRLQYFYAKEENMQKVLELDDALHKRFFTICSCGLVYKVTRGTMIHYDRVRELESTISAHKITIEDHKRLVDAIRKHDKVRAEDIMETHLDRWLINEKVLKEKYAEFFTADNGGKK